MKICNVCGTGNEGKFCKKCGASLDDAPEQNAQPAQPAQSEQSEATTPKETSSEKVEAAEKKEKPKLGISSILSVAGLVCLLLNVCATTLFSIIINVLYRVDTVSIGAINIVNIITNALGYLLLIAGSGVSIAGVVMTFTNKKLGAEAKLHCKVFSISIAALCVIWLFVTIISSIVIGII